MCQAAAALRYLVEGRRSAIRMHRAAVDEKRPSDVADVIAFVASDSARWIKGANIPVDGGSKL
jgi:NAD(P)-dependent dehydrogenase (short-subunit alcohol dehydrogenase family)